MSRKLIRFDWALKKLLRHKANFGILEGFLSELLRFDVTIESILENEGNKQDEYDKYNRVDILVKSADNELMLVEIQNDSEDGYFRRMLLGTSNLIAKHVRKEGFYVSLPKVYSINIVYSPSEQGQDYIYEYKNELTGLHEKDILQPTLVQKQRFKVETIADIFPKYYILKVNNFNDVAKDPLDEWVYFLKNSEVQDGFKAKGLDKAKEKMRYENLSDEEKKVYDRFQHNMRIETSVELTAKLEAREKAAVDIAKSMMAYGEPDEKIALYTGLTLEQIEQLRNS